MSSNYICHYKDIDNYASFLSSLSETDALLRSEHEDHPYPWITKPNLFAITLPEFDKVEDWAKVLSEYEHWHYSNVFTPFKAHVDQYIQSNELKDIISFRGKASMHHRFGSQLARLLSNIDAYDINGLTFSGTGPQKSNTFWKAVNNGGITSEQLHNALQKTLMPPEPCVKQLPVPIYIDLIPAQVRLCYINFLETLNNFANLHELLDLLFKSHHASVLGFYKDKLVDKDSIENELLEKFVFRGTEVKVNKHNIYCYIAPSLFSLLTFLFEKELVTMPTKDNLGIMISKDYYQDTLDKYILYRGDLKAMNPEGSSGAIRTHRLPIDDLTDGFDNPLTEYVLQQYNKETLKGTDITIIVEDIKNSASSFTAKCSDLLQDESVLAVYPSSSTSVCTYKHYDESIVGYDILFNRSNKLIVLPKAIMEHDWLSILNKYKTWVNVAFPELVPRVGNIALEDIVSQHLNLYDFIDKLSFNIEDALLSKDPLLSDSVYNTLFNSGSNCEDTKKYFILVGQSILTFLWLNEFILMPCHTRAVGTTVPLEKFVKGVDAVISDNASDLILNYLGSKPSLIKMLHRGFRRSVFASTPIKNIEDIHEGHMELIYVYGYQQAGYSTVGAFRLGIRGICTHLSPNDPTKIIDSKRLSVRGLKKRIPAIQDDLFYQWKEAGLYTWHEWLHEAAKVSDKLVSKTARKAFCKDFLPFLQNYSATTGLPIPETPFGITPRHIISESSNAPDFYTHVSSLKIQAKASIFNKVKDLYDVLQEYFPTQWTEASFVHPFPKKCPFPYNSRNATHRRPIESLHLDAIKEVLLSPDENGVPTFSWVRNEYCKYNPTSKNNIKDVLCTKDGNVWWPGTAVCLAFLLEVPTRGFQARWFDQGCLDDEIFNLETLKYEPNVNKVDITYPDGKSHQEKFKKYNGRSGILQQRPRSFMDTVGDNIRGASLFVNTNKTSVEQGKFNQCYSIPWPNEEETVLPYWLIQYMIDFNKKYDPTPKPINLCYEGEKSRSHSTIFNYSVIDDHEIVNKYPFVTPVFRDLTKDSRYAIASNKIVYDKDGNELVPPLTQYKLSELLNACAVEAEKRLINEGYSESLASMADLEGKVIYDVHTLRVTGVSRLMALGVPIEVVRDIVGHAVNVMTYYYTVLDQLVIMKKLRDGLSIDINHFGTPDIDDDALINKLIANTSADGTAIIQYGGWVERNGGICPSGVCDEGGPPTYNEQGKTNSFSPVPGGSFRCGNCRLWMTGPRYILQQVHYIDLVMKEIVNAHEDRVNIYQAKLENDAEIETLKRSKQSIPQSLYAKVSEYDANITQYTEKLAHLWMEWRNRYQMLETSISALDEYSADMEDGKLVLFTGQDPIDLNIQRNCGSKFGLKREIANSLIYQIPLSHEVSNVLNELERDITKLQMHMSSNNDIPVTIGQILDDDLRNRSIALHAQHLYLLMRKDHEDADQRIEHIISNISESLKSIDGKEQTALEQWHTSINNSLKDVVQLPIGNPPTKELPFISNITKEDDSND